jgi:hypothetical protein
MSLRHFDSGDGIVTIESRIGVQDFVERHSVREVFEQNFDRNARAADARPSRSGRT